MAIGPVQLIVLGFEQPDFHGEIIAELERLRESDTVRVIDALAVYKDAAGGFEVEHLSNLSKEEAIELGSTVGALVGLGIEGEEGLRVGAAAGAEAGAEGVEVFSDEDAWDMLEEIPNDSAAALLLLEHHWAVPLRDAVMRAGGFRIPTASSARSTSSTSAWSPPRKRSSSRPRDRRCGGHKLTGPVPRYRGDCATCSVHVESCDGYPGAPHDAFHDADRHRHWHALQVRGSAGRDGQPAAAVVSPTPACPGWDPGACCRAASALAPARATSAEIRTAAAVSGAARTSPIVPNTLPAAIVTIRTASG